MSKICLHAKITAAEGKAAECRAAIEATVAAADEEPGLLVYAATEDPNNEGTFVFFEVYADGDALGLHGKGERMAAAMTAMGGLLGAKPEIMMLNPVAAKGLEFS